MLFSMVSAFCMEKKDDDVVQHGLRILHGKEG
jgi:hypothetical protein